MKTILIYAHDQGQYQWWIRHKAFPLPEGYRFQYVFEANRMMGYHEGNCSYVLFGTWWQRRDTTEFFQEMNCRQIPRCESVEPWESDFARINGLLHSAGFKIGSIHDSHGFYAVWSKDCGFVKADVFIDQQPDNTWYFEVMADPFVKSKIRIDDLHDLTIDTIRAEVGDEILGAMKV